jgi:hypothetical protein
LNGQGNASGYLANINGMATNTGRGAARFTNRFTQAQKDALLRAVLIDGHTVKAARDLARAGQLTVPAFDIGTYAYDVIKQGRDSFEQSNETALDLAIDAELKKTAAAALAHNRGLLATFKRDGTSDPDALRRSAQTLSAIKRARREAANPRAVTKPRGATVQTSEPDDAYTGNQPNVVADLLAKADHGNLQGGRTGSLGRSRIDASPPAAA